MVHDVDRGVPQVLQPGETVDMPVSYYIDPAILEDANARRIDEITLSYTFYPTKDFDAASVTANSGVSGS